MIKRVYKIEIVLLLFIGLTYTPLTSSSSLSIYSANPDGWNVELDENLLSQGPGSDYISEISSLVVQDVLNIESDTSWALYIQSTSSFWSENITLYARVSAIEGEGSSELVQDEFIEVLPSLTCIVQGSGNFSSIGIQYAVDGISIRTVTDDHYEKNLIFSLVESL